MRDVRYSKYHHPSLPLCTFLLLKMAAALHTVEYSHCTIYYHSVHLLIIMVAESVTQCTYGFGDWK